MPTSASRAARPHRAPVAAILGLCLLLAGCDGSEDPVDPDGSPATTQPPPLVALPTPSDGGAVEITEIGFTILDQGDLESVGVVWAATFQNTSQTDLLAYVDFDVIWRGADGETEELRTTTSRELRAYDVLPGGNAVIGSDYFVDFVPDSLDVSVRTAEWAPMAALQANDLPVGVEVTGSEIELGTVATVRVQFDSSYEDQAGDDDLRITVALREASGALLGALWAESDFAASPPGEREQVGNFPRSRWPDQADVASSQPTVVKVCCAWVGAT
jgi:hypothetical protein